MLCKFSGFCNGVSGVSVLQSYDTAQQYFVPDTSRQCNILFSRVEDETIVPSRNISNQIHSDAVPCCGRPILNAASFLRVAVYHLTATMTFMLESYYFKVEILII
jgi:hypothetical protein